MHQCSATSRHGEPCRRLVHAAGERCTYHRDFLATTALPREYWFCAATNRSGRPCRRLVPAEGALCAYHAPHAEPVTPSASFETGPHPTDHLSSNAAQGPREVTSEGSTLSSIEREALAQAVLLPQPSSEIAILRILILHAAARCDLDSARRGMETLGRLLKIQHDLERDSPSEEPLLEEPPLEEALLAWAEDLVAAE